MRRPVFGLLALVTACGGGSTGAVGALDASLSDGSAGAEGGLDPCADAGVPASSLACTGLYSNFATKVVASNALAYTPSTPLWSDGAQKARWIELPPNTQIDISNPDEWTFPVGTKLFKEFQVSGRRVETRMFQKTKSNFWVYAAYAWNGDDSAAPINYGGAVPVGDAGTWKIPTNDDCDECHRGRQDRILGFEHVSLGLPGAQGLTLADLASRGLVTPAPASTSLQIGDDGTGLDALALGWIHVNCGVSCHNENPASSGYGAGMLLRLDPTQLNGSAPTSAWDVYRTTINVPCISGGVSGQPRIVPGNPADSVVYQLMSERGTLQMPPIASVLVDTSDVAVVRSWVEAMASDAGPLSDDAGAQDSGRHDHDGGLGLDGSLVDGAGLRDASGAVDGSLSDASDASPLESDDGAPPDGGAADAGDATLGAEASIDGGDASAGGEGGGNDGSEDAGSD